MDSKKISDETVTKMMKHATAPAIPSGEETAAEKKSKKIENAFAKAFAMWAGTIYNFPAILCDVDVNEEIFSTQDALNADPNNWNLKRQLAEAKLFRSSLDVPLLTKYVKRIKSRFEPVELPSKDYNDDELFRTFLHCQLLLNRSSKVQSPDNHKSFNWYVEWLKKWAEYGIAYYQYELGCCYLYGEGIDQDDSMASSWIMKAAEQGHIRAQEHLGTLYLSGQGVPNDKIKANEWLTKAANQVAVYIRTKMIFSDINNL